MKSSLFIAHFAAAVILTCGILLVYASVQQAHRSAANDPQLQLARDLGIALNSGKTVNNLFPKDTIDIAQSLAVFAETFDEQGNPLRSTGLLNGQLPQPPAGVLDFTKNNQEDVITWQPENGVRMAMVYEKVNAAGTGFVAVGRSLKEVELRENKLVRMVAIAWIACLAVLLVHLLVQIYLFRKASIKQAA
ncbi:MAG TPA: hypothetical protein VEV83_04490 [Parafilimonas sp.]|nr:hypothetical protein [Parafilimonas sp.]